MEHACEPIVRVDRRQHPDVVTACGELIRESFNMGQNTAWVRVGIGANQAYSHGFRVAAPAVLRGLRQ